MNERDEFSLESEELSLLGLRALNILSLEEQITDFVKQSEGFQKLISCLGDKKLKNLSLQNLSLKILNNLEIEDNISVLSPYAYYPFPNTQT